MSLPCETVWERHASLRCVRDTLRAVKTCWSAWGTGAQDKGRKLAERGRFAELVPQHIPVMRRTAIALVGLADAEDAAQEAILRAWQTWDSLNEEVAVRAWLLRITVNVCLQWRRGWLGKRLARTQPLSQGDEEVYFAPLSYDPGTSDHTSSLDIRLALSRLATEQRLAITLRFYAGMDSTEAGSALGIPAATFRTRLSRALAALRAEMEHGALPDAAAEEQRHV